ncbi:MAG: GNAT family N-acetyltransferase [Oscillospiraceae bacterium]|nr:GNAT family N-acetyltransferase [Oscillospiraceae bacterium]
MQHFGTKTFETSRLICRQFISEDYEDMLRNWAADPCIQVEYGEPVYDSVYKVKELLSDYIDNYHSPDYYRWAIIEKSSKANIGQIAFCKVYSECQTAEIEYCIGKEFWGKGYAGEALEGLIDFAFRNTDFIKLEAYHRCENQKSGRVLEKSKMHITSTVERFIRENIIPQGEVCYCITKDTYDL